jgi:DNA-binding transcriptional regulator YiaG
MPELSIDDIIAKAKTDTDNKFKNKMASLTKLTNSEIDDLLQNTGIKKENFAAVVKEVTDATKSNEDKAKAIANISKGVSVLVGIAQKLL